MTVNTQKSFLFWPEYRNNFGPYSIEMMVSLFKTLIGNEELPVDGFLDTYDCKMLQTKPNHL